ncbi:MAG: SurA N-terminal domain-containing protein, partial [Candidatus Omnitrophica bacterium]|nr:SurA N-terminal domain-containing protein [Candidatus Omnitrophota bacterium]
MKKICYCITVLVFAISFLTGCSSGSADLDSKTLARVNKGRIMVEDLRYELKNAPYDEVHLLKAKSERRDYLDRLVEKEVLLQEAQHQGLHREKDFMKSIEGYWEQALLKILLERKSDEISGLTHVSDNEIEEYY